MNTIYCSIRSALTIILGSTLTCAFLSAQAPERIGYQTVVRDNSNNLVTSSEVGMRISILKTSPTGSTAYSETQKPVTNINGLATVEIGAGNVIKGSVSDINWAAGPYFIKIETDPSGGTNYVITSTFQLLSVPYALHAKTAEAITSAIPETDPNYSHWDKDYNDFINKPEITNPQSYSIGDFAFGGIVFWVDETGHHGLVCLLWDIGPCIWHSEYVKVQANGDGPLAGEMNSIIINSFPAQMGSAANLCLRDYSAYLPSKEEMNLIFQNREVINASLLSHSFSALSSTAVYWTSTERNSTSAWAHDFHNQSQSTFSKANSFLVRPIKAF